MFNIEVDRIENTITHCEEVLFNNADSDFLSNRSEAWEVYSWAKRELEALFKAGYYGTAEQAEIAGQV
jgi:hypothetical protein